MIEKRTKIVCTIGPSCEGVDTLQSMIESGMNVARLNFSHGTYENHELLINNIRKAAEKAEEPVAIMQDVQGPKIRVGSMPDEGFEISEDEEVLLDTSKKSFSNEKELIPVDYEDLHEFVEQEERVFISDGEIELKIEEVQDTKIKTRVISEGVIYSHKGINVPDSQLEVRAVTEKDKEDIKFGVKQGVDLLAVSFVRTAEDVLDARRLIKEYEEELDIKNKQPIRIVAKIERGDAVENINEIMEVVDGIMVARGDLGIEIPAEKVPLQQKNLIELAIKNSKPVIVATQMLDSMQDSPRPTRAEVSDVSNAVIDHTDAVMLSNETAVGKYPVETVKTMANIIKEAEESHYDDLPPPKVQDHILETEEVLTSLSRIVSEEVGAKLILAASISGRTARLISKFRPELPIAVATSTERVQKQLNLSWGVLPFILPDCNTIEELINRSVAHLKKDDLVEDGDKIIVVAGEPVGDEGQVNLLEVKEV